MNTRTFIHGKLPDYEEWILDQYYFNPRHSDPGFYTLDIMVQVLRNMKEDDAVKIISDPRFPHRHLLGHFPGHRIEDRTDLYTHALRNAMPNLMSALVKSDAYPCHINLSGGFGYKGEPLDIQIQMIANNKFDSQTSVLSVLQTTRIYREYIIRIELDNVTRKVETASAERPLTCFDEISYYVEHTTTKTTRHLSWLQAALSAQQFSVNDATIYFQYALKSFHQYHAAFRQFSKRYNTLQPAIVAETHKIIESCKDTDAYVKLLGEYADHLLCNTRSEDPDDRPVICKAVKMLNELLVLQPDNQYYKTRRNLFLSDLAKLPATQPIDFHDPIQIASLLRNLNTGNGSANIKTFNMPFVSHQPEQKVTETIAPQHRRNFRLPFFKKLGVPARTTQTTKINRALSEIAGLDNTLNFHDPLTVASVIRNLSSDVQDEASERKLFTP